MKVRGERASPTTVTGKVGRRPGELVAERREASTAARDHDHRDAYAPFLLLAVEVRSVTTLRSELDTPTGSG
jgi:hypothetical protein